MTELMNGGVIFKRAIHFPDRVESSGAAFKSKNCYQRISNMTHFTCAKRTSRPAAYFCLNSRLFSFFFKTFAPQITLLQDSANVLFTGMKTDLALSHIPSLNLFKSLSGTSLSFESKHWPHLSENQWSAVCLFFSGGWITALFQSFEDWICWNISTILSGPAASEWRCHRDSRKDVWNLVSPKHRSTLVSDHLP